MSKRGPRAEQKLATRARLVRVARREFAERGYDAASVAVVCRQARVTHGALYHHFPSKQHLFAAVVQELTHELALRVEHAAHEASGWEQVDAACDAYLEACLEPAVQTIVFRDGPRVLHEHFDAVDRETNEPLVSGLLRRWMDEGLLRQLPIVSVAHMLGAAFAEAGLAIGNAETAGVMRSMLGQVLRDWLRALRAE